MLKCICVICRKEFFRKKSQIKLAIKHYCSIPCAEKGRRKGKFMSCFVCKKEVYKSLKELKRSKSKKYFCSRKCANVWIGTQQRYINSPNWKGGVFSYRQILSRDSVTKVRCMLCTEKDSRMLAVHHIDKNRSNNSIKNLAWFCHNCHFLVHNYAREEKIFSQKLHAK